MGGRQEGDTRTQGARRRAGVHVVMLGWNVGCIPANDGQGGVYKYNALLAQVGSCTAYRERPTIRREAEHRVGIGREGRQRRGAHRLCLGESESQRFRQGNTSRTMYTSCTSLSIFVRRAV